MARIKGIGGVFFKAKDPQAMAKWYQDHLGIPAAEEGYATLHWREHDSPDHEQFTVWSPFAEDSDYFEPSNKPFMINYIVEDIDGLLEELRAAGVWVDEKRDDQPYGRFAWIKDPEGTRIELWEPPAPALGNSDP